LIVLILSDYNVVMILLIGDTNMPAHNDINAFVFDAHGVANFDFLVVWVNPFGQAKENFPSRDEHEIVNLSKSPHLFNF
jgi:hypothetical protein